MILTEILKNEEERRIHESRQAFISDLRTNQIEYERRAVKAREEGIEIGREKGKEEGLIEAAKKLIASGMDTKTVCEMLGISESDLT